MRYFLGFLAAIGLVVLVFILILRGLSGPRQSNVQTLLTDYSKTQTVMRMTIDGPVNADQNHRQVRVTVGRDENMVETITGYQGEVLDTKTYPNNEEAYYTFLRALQLQGYTKGNPDEARADERGVCATGKRYIFEIITGSATVQRYWTTSCDGGGTFTGNTSTIRLLFQKQVPDYSKMTRGMGVN
jgi:hypothetical protein